MHKEVTYTYIKLLFLIYAVIIENI